VKLLNHGVHALAHLGSDVGPIALFIDAQLNDFLVGLRNAGQCRPETVSILAAQHAGSFPLTITATYGSEVAAETFMLSVGQADVTSLPSASFTAGQYSAFAITTDALPEVKTTITEVGMLPAGVKLQDNHKGSASLTGKPAASAGGVYPITLIIKSGGVTGTQQFTLTVNSAGQLPSFTGPAAAIFAVGRPNTFTIPVNSGAGPPKVSLMGKLPPGVTLKLNGQGIVLSGTPTAKSAGRYVFTPVLANAAGRASETFTLTVDQPLAITTTKSTRFAVGQIGTFLVKAAGYPPANRWSLTGTVPAWVEIVDNGNGTATLIGTPPPLPGVAQTYLFTIVAQNSAGSMASQPFALTVSQSPIFISPTAPLTLSLVQPMTPFTIQTAPLPPGVPVPKLTRTGTLPPGLKFKDNGNGTATLTGTPKKPGSYQVVITANDGIGPAAMQLLTIVIR
jgi:hypothetical protein